MNKKDFDIVEKTAHIVLKEKDMSWLDCKELVYWAKDIIELINSLGEDVYTISFDPSQMERILKKMCIVWSVIKSDAVL